jgi:hypothetical protein
MPPKISKFLIFWKVCDAGLKKNSRDRLWREVRKKPCASQWRREENLQIKEVFFRASLRTGQNDTRELDHEKKMQWDGVSDEWALVLIARMHFKCLKWPSQQGVFLTFSGVLFQARITTLPRKLWNFEIFQVRVKSSVYCSMTKLDQDLLIRFR